MLFYLYKDPPTGLLDLETIEVLLLERFQHYLLSTDLQYDTEEFNYCDKVSHLFMCIIAIDYPLFKDSFIKGEIKLFHERLANKNCLQIKKALLETSKYLDILSQSEEFKKVKSVRSDQYQLLQHVIHALLSKCGHSFKKLHSVQCRKYKLTLPFTFTAKLVSKREVEVHNGKVSLSCGEWKKLLEIIFEFLLKIEIELIENCESIRKLIDQSENDQIRQIIKRCTNFLSGSLSKEKEVIEADEIDSDSQYFPPCMANLHQILRQKHRLSYESRYQYTLFLKDIGLSVDENILFWEREYSKPHEGSSCCHDWHEKETRYKYQIQHLYGLIGSHGLKTSHSCDKFIQELQTKMDGGCPFQHLTSEQLENALPNSIAALPDVEDIFQYKKEGLPQKACAQYLKLLIDVLERQFGQVNIRRNFYIVSPLQFYNLAKGVIR